MDLYFRVGRVVLKQTGFQFDRNDLQVNRRPGTEGTI